MPMKLKLLLASMLCFSLGVHHPASAHDPALHGFSLVTFEKPFAAPAFDLETLSGGSASLDDFRGKYVLVNFWATWCPPCLEEMPSLNALHARLAERGFTVAAISSDEEGQAIVAPFIDSLGVEFPVLLDPDKTVSLSYGARPPIATSCPVKRNSLGPGPSRTGN